MRDGLRLYGHYVSIHIKSMMQYKSSFFLAVTGQFLVSFNVFLGMFFMEFSLAECVARGFDTFSSMVRKGEFDRVLVRPRGAVLQVLGSRFELTRIGRMLQAAVMFGCGVGKSGISWDVPRVITVVFMVAGGTALFFGIFLVGAALCGRSIREKNPAAVHLCGALRAGAALSPSVSSGEEKGGVVDVRAPSGLRLRDPLLWDVESGSEAISVGGIIIKIVCGDRDML